MPPIHIDLDWADGTYRFALPVAQLRDLQHKTGIGPLALYNRLLSGQWRVDDMGEVLRLGLIGGGLSPVAALEKTRAYVDPRPLTESVDPALRVLERALLPAPGEEDGAGSDDGTGSDALKKSLTILPD